MIIHRTILIATILFSVSLQAPGQTKDPGRTHLVIYFQDGTQRSFPLADISRMEFQGAVTTIPTSPNSIQLFASVARQNSQVFRPNRFPEIEVQTTQNDRTPYDMAKPFTGKIYLSPNQRCVLAGDAAGTARWNIDNFLYFEVVSSRGTNRFVVGGVEPVTRQGQRLTHVGGFKFDFAPGEIDLTDYIPKNETVELRVRLLDYGGVGFASNIFLIIR